MEFTQYDLFRIQVVLDFVVTIQKQKTLNILLKVSLLITIKKLHCMLWTDCNFQSKFFKLTRVNNQVTMRQLEPIQIKEKIVFRSRIRPRPVKCILAVLPCN